MITAIYKDHAFVVKPTEPERIYIFGKNMHPPSNWIEIENNTLPITGMTGFDALHIFTATGHYVLDGDTWDTIRFLKPTSRGESSKRKKKEGAMR